MDADDSLEEKRYPMSSREAQRFELDQFLWSRLHIQISGSAIPPFFAFHTLVSGSSEGEILCFGGMTRGGKCTSRLWKCNVKQLEMSECKARGIWPSPRFMHSSVCVQNRMYVFGGDSGSEVIGDLWAWDIHREVWQKVRPFGPVPSARRGHGVLRRGSSMIIMGGEDPYSRKKKNDVWIFNVDLNEWTEVKCKGKLPPSRSQHIFCNVEEKIVLCGGCGLKGQFNDTWELLLGTPCWKKLNTLSHPLKFCAATGFALLGGLVVFGGKANSVSEDIWELNVGSMAWNRISKYSQRKGSPDFFHKPCRRYGHGGIVLEYENNMALVIGGKSEPNGKILGDIWLLSRCTSTEAPPVSPLRSPLSSSFSSYQSSPETTRRSGNISNRSTPLKRDESIEENVVLSKTIIDTSGEEEIPIDESTEQFVDTEEKYYNTTEEESLGDNAMSLDMKDDVDLEKRMAALDSQLKESLSIIRLTTESDVANILQLISTLRAQQKEGFDMTLKRLDGIERQVKDYEINFRSSMKDFDENGQHLLGDVVEEWRSHISLCDMKQQSLASTLEEVSVSVHENEKKVSEIVTNQEELVSEVDRRIEGFRSVVETWKEKVNKEQRQQNEILSSLAKHAKRKQSVKLDMSSSDDVAEFKLLEKFKRMETKMESLLSKWSEENDTKMEVIESRLGNVEKHLEN